MRLIWRRMSAACGSRTARPRIAGWAPSICLLVSAGLGKIFTRLKHYLYNSARKSAEYIPAPFETRASILRIHPAPLHACSS